MKDDNNEDCAIVIAVRRGNGGGGASSVHTETPAIDAFTTDLTALAREGALDPVIGREHEIERALRILARRTKNNPVLVGDAGTGKTAIAEGIAQEMAAGNAPAFLSKKRLLLLDMGSLVAGTRYRGDFEDRIKRLLREVELLRNIILFIDEIHTIVGAGSASGSMDASNLLKPALARGALRVIGATTHDEFRKCIEKDAALERRFGKVMVKEPSAEATEKILAGLKQRYEEYHRVRYTDEAIHDAAYLAARYISGRFMPDKAIDVLDEAGALVKLRSGDGSEPDEADYIDARIRALDEEHAALLAVGDEFSAAELSEKIRVLRRALESAQVSRRAANAPVVDSDSVRAVISEISGVPASGVGEDESERLLKLEDELHRTVIGQDEAVREIAQAVRRSRLSLSDPQRPVGSFLLLGPTGVGKTLLARTLAKALFGGEDSLIRIDMADFMEKHAASRLVGAPPGFIGFEEGGELTEKIRRNPYRVVLFDEVEKADREVSNLLLSILEEGELKDNMGRTANFRHSVIILTSNVGAKAILGGERIGFGESSGTPGFADIKHEVESEAKRMFNPELLNRLDKTIVFRPLSEEQLRVILDGLLDELGGRIKRELGVTLRVSRPARNLLLRKAESSKWGARALRRIVRSELEDPLSIVILNKRLSAGTVFNASAKKDEIVMETV